jgi:hypothetical protein
MPARRFDSPAPSLAFRLRNLCIIERRLDRLAQAEAAGGEILDVALAMVGENHSIVGILLRDQARFRMNQDDLDEAKALIEQSVNTLQRVLGRAHEHTISSLALMAQVRQAKE